MADTEHNPSDINDPAHRADGAELAMGAVAVAVAFILALVITGFHPSKS